MKQSTLTIANIPILVSRKKMKTLRLAVYPPDGEVRISVPLRVADEQIRQMVLSRLDWIRTQQLRFANQPRQTAREYVSGESHYFQGRRYTLEVMHYTGKPSLSLTDNAQMLLQISPDSSSEKRAKLMSAWYRAQLKNSVEQLLLKWQPIVGKQVNDWGIKQMKTKWGTCNITARRIWLNLELIKKPPACLEYVLVHELVHLHERYHNARFWQLMDEFLPDWRNRRALLNSAPLGHDDWEC